MSDEISLYLQQSQKIDGQTAEAVWREFFPRLMQLARKKLGSLPRRDADEEDIAQSAMISFFNGLEQNRFANLDGRDEIWRLLVTIAARKISAKRRKAFAQKRGGGNVRGESAFDGLANNEGDSSPDGIAQIMDENRMPESADAIAQACDELLAKLNDQKLRETALLRMEGYTNSEIAARLNCSVSRVKQRIALIKEIWTETAE